MVSELDGRGYLNAADPSRSCGPGVFAAPAHCSQIGVYMHALSGHRKSVLGAAVSLTLLMNLLLATAASAATLASWPTYLGSAGRTGFNSAETVIRPATASRLKRRWADSSGPVSAEPVDADGVVYYGSWDGYERAVKASTGARLWSRYLGETTDTNCSPPSAGIASTATVGTVTIRGKATRTVFVGGGNGIFYALNAVTGAVLWERLLGVSPRAFLWSSSVFYNGLIYEGVSSFGDCPLVRGRIVAINAVTGHIRYTLFTAPQGCVGASVWGSPAVDTTTGDIYFGTGNGGAGCTEPLSVAVIQASPSLSLLSHWKVPSTAHGPDSDFGSTPTLFTWGGRASVGMQDKNGLYYAFRRNSLRSGPIWQARIAAAGQCPECGSGDISSSAWDGRYLYIGSGSTTINGVSCLGSVQALRPGSGRAVWRKCLQDGPVLGAITAVPGVLFLGEGSHFEAVSAGSGKTLFAYQDSNAGSDF